MGKLQLAKRYQVPADNLLMEIASLASQRQDIIDLSLGDPDFTTDATIIEAAFADAKAGHTKYTASGGSPEFIAAVIDFYQKQYDLHFLPEQVRGTVGAMHGMYLTLQVLLDPGDEVIIHEPYFTPYKDQVLMAGGKPVFVPTYEKDDFQLDLDLLEQGITPRTKALIINSPNNPTGAVFSEEIFQGIADLAKKYQLFILSDEVYEAFTYQETFKPMACFAPEQTITFSSFSKTFAMTGWRIGYMIAPTAINQAVKLVNESITYSAPSISQQGGIFALKQGATIWQPIVDTFESRLNYVAQRVAQNAYLTMGPVKGSMYAFINIKKTGLDSVAFVEKVLQETGVLLIPGEAFGENTGKHHVRLAATQRQELLEEAFDRIDQLTFSF